MNFRGVSGWMQSDSRCGMRRAALRHVLLGWVLVCLLAPSAAWARFIPPPPCRNKFTHQQEITEGEKVAAQIYQQMPVLPDSDPVAQYVSQLGQRLAAHAPGYKWPFNYHVVASSDINAFALPGGSIFVNLGTVQAAESEAQLAGVLAHETSHVVLRHSTCNITKQQGPDIAYGIGSLLSQIVLGNGMAGALAQAGLGGLKNLQFLSMSREDEKQADLLGTDILYDSGFDPRGLPQFFEIIQSKYGAGGAQFLSDHPNPGNRTEYVNAEIATLPRLAHPIVTSAEFNRVHALAMKERTFNAQQVKDGAWKSFQYASGPGASDAGYTGAAGAQPVEQATGRPPKALSRAELGIGGPMASYRGTGNTMQYPASWQASTDSTGSATFAPERGARSFGIAYGAMLAAVSTNGTAIPDANALISATQQIAQQLTQQNPGLQQYGQPQTTMIGPHPANTLEMRGSSPIVENGHPLPERDWLVTVARPDGNIEYMVFICPERDFQTLRPLFDVMMQSLRFN